MKIYEMGEVPKTIMMRAKTDVDSVKESVGETIKNIRKNGDTALRKYTEKFDRVLIEDFKTSEDEIREAYEEIDPLVLEKIKEQIEYSKKFASADKKNLKEEWSVQLGEGIEGGLKLTPIESVGLYVPGGKNPFPTVMQILAIPAKIAGVEKIVACTPPQKDGKILAEVLVAADLCGVDEVYKMGGAQAVAAFAYGTESVPKVLKVVGPGNPYVTAAKLLCFGEIGIDMPAGPSEALIIADEGATPSWLAADILARAEHGPDSAAVLVTWKREIAEKTLEEVGRQKKERSRQEYIETALEKYCAVVLVKDLREAVDFANEYAPEHLELQVESPREILPLINNAGSVFLGYYNPVAVGDYASGVNHILPTGQWAKMFSPVSVETFMKRVQFSYVNKTGLEKLKGIVDTIADIEGLDAHRESVDIRLR
ncbi:MAG: histidinol dehydrogenase [archaeon]